MNDKPTDSTRQTRDREEFIASIRQIVAGDDELLRIAMWMWDVREADPERARAIVAGVRAVVAGARAAREGQR